MKEGKKLYVLPDTGAALERVPWVPVNLLIINISYKVLLKGRKMLMNPLKKGILIKPEPVD